MFSELIKFLKKDRVKPAAPAPSVMDEIPADLQVCAADDPKATLIWAARIGNRCAFHALRKSYFGRAVSEQEHRRQRAVAYYDPYTRNIRYDNWADYNRYREYRPAQEGVDAVFFHARVSSRQRRWQNWV